MDRMLVLTMAAPIPRRHRVEVTEETDAAFGRSSVLSIVDLETGVRYQRAEEPLGTLSTWVGRVLECTITSTADGARTALSVDPVGPGASEADVALHGADAAADAARVEAVRWSGVVPESPPEAPRIW
ncbi:MAG: hypothetical protein ACQEW8_03800 [Actinomycetota bacterium]